METLQDKEIQNKEDKIPEWIRVIRNILDRTLKDKKTKAENLS